MGSGQSALLRQDNFGFPPEIIDVILGNLRTPDLENCRLVCQEWNERAYLALSATAIYVVDFNQTDSQCVLDHVGSWKRFAFYGAPAQVFANSRFWDQYHLKITTVKFENCSIFHKTDEEQTTLEYYKQKQELLCPNLRNLAVIHCPEYFRDYGTKFCLQNVFHLKNLHVLDVSDNSYLRDDIVMGILDSTSCLQSIDFSNTAMNCNSVIFNRFYPTVPLHGTLPPAFAGYSSDVFTFQMLRMGFLATAKAAKLYELRLNGIQMDGENLLTLSNPKEYVWTSISLQANQINGFQLQTFLDRQRSISRLKIDHDQRSSSRLLLGDTLAKLDGLRNLSVRCTHVGVVSDIEVGIQNLQQLCISATDKLIDPVSLIPLSSLKNLRILKFTNLSKRDGLMPRPPALFPLSSESKIPEKEAESSRKITLSSVLQGLTKLTVLNLSLCSWIVTDDTVQTIIKNMTTLRRLDLSNCEFVTDLGMAGMFSCVDNLRCGHLSLNHLRGLVVLKLKNCKRLGEPTFENAIEFQFLEELDLCGTRVEANGLEAILEKCRCLVYLRQSHVNLRVLKGYSGHPNLRRT